MINADADDDDDDDDSKMIRLLCRPIMRRMLAARRGKRRRPQIYARAKSAAGDVDLKNSVVYKFLINSVAALVAQIADANLEASRVARRLPRKLAHSPDIRA